MKKRKQLPAISDAQLEVMSVVWSLGEASVADVWRELSDRRKIARNTVQTTMVRLEEKGYLQHRTVGNAFRYSATVERENIVRRMLRTLLDGAFQGSTEGLLMTLLEDSPPSADEVKRIRKLLSSINREKPEE